MQEIVLVQLSLPNGKLVLQRRDEDTEVSPGLLGFFGGHVEDDETPEEAMRRELSEETSLNVSALEITYVVNQVLPHPKYRDTVSIRAYLYKTSIGSDDFDVFEGQRAETYSLSELKARQDLALNAKYMIDHFVA